MKQTTPSSRRSAGWVTDLTDKYRFDANVRTTVQIIVLQVSFTLLSIVAFGWALQYVQLDTSAAIIQHIQDVLTRTATSSDSLSRALHETHRNIYILVSAVLLILNIVFGYLIAQFALRPTRQTLAYQKRFIGNIAHEIRTPLAIIKTSTEVVLFDPSLPKTVREAMEGTVTELDRISETINNLLSLDTLARPKTMHFEPVDVGAVAVTVVERHQELAHSRGLHLEGEIAPSAFVLGNATALDQIITNLTKNALTYTPKDKDGKVVVSVSTEFKSVVISVRDNGIGIPEKDIQHIFEPFYRADTSRARDIGTGSSGLGLAIVNEIIRLHHGTITVRSTVGEGTTVHVTLPRTHKSALTTGDV